MINETTKQQANFFVYIAQCSDGSYYTGHAKNVEKRIKAHNDGKEEKSLKRRLPIALVWEKEYQHHKNPLREEKNIKELKNHQKLKLIKIYEEENQ